MPKRAYTLTFIGRPSGALGHLSEYVAVRLAESPDAARELLYDQYEHITVRTCVAAREEPEPDDRTRSDRLADAREAYFEGEID